MWPSQLKWVGLLLCHFLGMANFPKGVSWHWFWVFNRISLSNLFYTRKYTSYTYKKFISDISKCLKQATHEKGVGEVSKTAQIQISFSWFAIAVYKNELPHSAYQLSLKALSAIGTLISSFALHINGKRTFQRIWYKASHWLSCKLFEWKTLF